MKHRSKIMSRASTRWLPLVAAGLLMGACSDSEPEEATTYPDAVLKDEFGSAFLVGTTLNAEHIYGRDTAGISLILRHFNAISPENILKWEVVHPEPNRYDFEASDRYVAFGEQHGMYIVGHTLVWHSQTPSWVWEDAQGKPMTREALLERMRDHIHTVVGRYKGRIDAWDVVNEALNEDGTLRESPWMRIIGEDYIAKAFQFAHEADPDAKLYYNDYSLERPDKRAGAVRLIQSLQAQGVPVHGIGTQNHQKMDWPTVAAQDSTLQAFADLGIEVAVTELDIDVLPRATRNQGADVSLTVEQQPELNPYAGGLPDSVQTALAQRYQEFFEVYLKHRNSLERVTFWGVTDADSWLNDWPVRGRSSYPLLHDRAGQPKPAFHSVIRAAREAADQ